MGDDQRRRVQAAEVRGQRGRRVQSDSNGAREIPHAGGRFPPDLLTGAGSRREKRAKKEGVCGATFWALRCFQRCKVVSRRSEEDAMKLHLLKSASGKFLRQAGHAGCSARRILRPARGLCGAGILRAAAGGNCAAPFLGCAVSLLALLPVSTNGWCRNGADRLVCAVCVLTRYFPKW